MSRCIKIKDSKTRDITQNITYNTYYLGTEFYFGVWKKVYEIELQIKGDIFILLV